MNHERNSRVLSLVLVLCFLFSIGTFVRNLSLTADKKVEEHQITGVDYADYYAAGRMVIEGNLANIYHDPIHQQRLEEILGRDLSFTLAWPYPPTFLLAIVPLAYLPFYASLITWLVLTLALVFFSVYKLVPKYPKLTLLALGFPGMYWTLKWGQNGFLSSGLIGFGLYFLESNPVLSGIIFGLLSYKPQIAIFPFLLLLFSKKWRVLLWSAISATVFAAISALVFGVGPWVNFFNSFFSTSSDRYLDWSNYALINPSLYSFFRIPIQSDLFSYAALAVCGIAVLLVACWIWRKSDNLALKGAALVIGIPLTTSYFLQYDLSILVIPLVLLAYDFARNGFKLSELIILEMLFLMPLINMRLVYATGVQICPVVLVIVLLMTLERARTGHKQGQFAKIDGIPLRGK